MYLNSPEIITHLHLYSARHNPNGISPSKSKPNKTHRGQEEEEDHQKDQRNSTTDCIAQKEKDSFATNTNVSWYCHDLIEPSIVQKADI